MSSDEHAHNHAPQLPEVVDEAGDTPGWVPLLGIALFVLFVGYVAWGHAKLAEIEADTSSAGAP